MFEGFYVIKVCPKCWNNSHNIQNTVNDILSSKCHAIFDVTHVAEKISYVSN